MAAVLALVALLLTGAGQRATLPDSVFLFQSSFGAFDEATRITIGPTGRIYVIDAAKNCIEIFKAPRDSPSVLGGYGWTNTAFDRPTGVATDGLNVYVSDFGNHRIQRFDRYSGYISSLQTRDTIYAPAQFGYPGGIALTNQGDLLILDGENLRVVEFSADSRFERDFGGINTSGGKLQDPIKICLEADRLVYVLQKHNVVVFDFYGNYLRTIAEELDADFVGGQSTPNGLAIVAGDTLYWYDAEGILLSKIPFGMLFADEPVTSVQDIAFSDNQLFVLTEHRCFVFSIQPAAH